MPEERNMSILPPHFEAGQSIDPADFLASCMEPVYDEEAGLCDTQLNQECQAIVDAISEPLPQAPRLDETETLKRLTRLFLDLEEDQRKQWEGEGAPVVVTSIQEEKGKGEVKEGGSSASSVTAQPQQQQQALVLSAIHAGAEVSQSALMVFYQSYEGFSWEVSRSSNPQEPAQSTATDFEESAGDGSQVVVTLVSGAILITPEGVVRGEVRETFVEEEIVDPRFGFLKSQIANALVQDVTLSPPEDSVQNVSLVRPSYSFQPVAFGSSFDIAQISATGRDISFSPFPRVGVASSHDSVSTLNLNGVIVSAQEVFVFVGYPIFPPSRSAAPQYLSTFGADAKLPDRVGRKEETPSHSGNGRGETGQEGNKGNPDRREQEDPGPSVQHFI